MNLADFDLLDAIIDRDNRLAAAAVADKPHARVNATTDARAIREGKRTMDPADFAYASPEPLSISLSFADYLNMDSVCKAARDLLVSWERADDQEAKQTAVDFLRAVVQRLDTCSGSRTER